MPEQITVLTSRRAYEFHPNELRLSMLSTKPIQELLERLFQFQTSAMGTPMPTFGSVPATYPPGVVFNMGVYQAPDGQFVPIRFLHFEQLRIVIDVAGPSNAINGMFEQLTNYLSQIHAPDGSPIIGEPERILNYSEISARFSFPLETIFTPPMRKLFARFIRENATSEEVVPVPSLIIQAHSNTEKYAGTVNANDPHSFTLALRAGSRPEEHEYFSAVPLDSDKHLDYLNELETVLTTE